MPVAVIGHMQRFYDLLDSKAEDAHDGGRVYEGQITTDFNSLDLPQPYYSRMTRLMQKMGCMTQLQRGTRNVPSRWALHARPTEELYAQIDPKEGQIDAVAEQVRILQATEDQKLRVIRNELNRINSRITHMQAAVAQQASMLTQVFKHLGLELEAPPTVEVEPTEEVTFTQEYPVTEGANN